MRAAWTAGHRGGGGEKTYAYFQADWICRIFLIAMVVAMAMGGFHADSTFMNISNLPLANEDDQAEDNSSHTSISTDNMIDNLIDAGRNKMDEQITGRWQINTDNITMTHFNINGRRSRTGHSLGTTGDATLRGIEGDILRA